MAGEGEREVHGFNRVDDDRTLVRREYFLCSLFAAGSHIPGNIRRSFKPDRDCIVGIGDIPSVSSKHDDQIRVCRS
jgi:hypothetical protein